MIAADISTGVAYFENIPGNGTDLLDRALSDRRMVMPPAVAVELLSDPKLDSVAAGTVRQLPMIESEPGDWAGAGASRAKVLRRRRMARLGDAPIAQN